MNSRDELIDQYFAKKKLEESRHPTPPAAVELLPSIDDQLPQHADFDVDHMDLATWMAVLSDHRNQEGAESEMKYPTVLPIALEPTLSDVYLDLMGLLEFKDFPVWFGRLQTKIITRIESNPLDDEARQYLEDVVARLELENDMLSDLLQKIPTDWSADLYAMQPHAEPFFTRLSAETDHFQERKQRIELCLNEFQHAYERMKGYCVHSHLSTYVTPQALGIENTCAYYNPLASYKSLIEHIPANARTSIESAMAVHDKQIDFIKNELLKSFGYILK